MIDIIRQFFTWVDSIIYGFIGGIYNLIETMTTYRIFDANEDFLTNKIYTLLSIFMLFKVSFSFINYLVNPDSFTDKEKGVQKIVVNVVVMFILLVISPWAFKQMWNLQDALIKENVIEAFIFEDAENSLEDNSFTMWKGCTETSTAATDGDYIALMVLRGFFQPYDENNLPTVGCNIEKATPSSYLTNVDKIVNKKSGKQYLIDYKIIVSTAVGVVVLLILIGFAMDVGLRVIKLSFLQLIAPIPIVSYVDPSSSKNGMFIKWLKEVGATWASVFIRLFALFFAVRIIQELGKPQLMTIYGEEAEPNFLITVFLIIGALMFAKQLPKLISDITGFKIDGGFNLNPLKKIENEALGGKQIASIPGRTIGAVAGGLGGAISGFNAGAEVGNRGAGLRMGLMSGVAGGFKNSKGAFTNQMREQYKNLTGNEMARFSLNKMLLQKKGNELVKGENGFLKKMGDAYKDLNVANSKLNTAQTHSANLRAGLSRYGFDGSNLENVKSGLINNQKSVDEEIGVAQIEFDNQEQNYQAIMGMVNSERERYEKAKEIANQADSSIIVGGVPANRQKKLDAQKIVDQFEKGGYLENLETQQQKAFASFENARNNLSQKQAQKVEISSAINSITEFEVAQQTENELRQIVSDITRSIDTIKKEKAQVERFYQVDSSTQEEYNAAIKRLAKAKEKLNNSENNT